MELDGDCLRECFSSVGRAGFIKLDVSRFYEILAVYRDIFTYFNRISSERLDRDYIVNVLELME